MSEIEPEGIDWARVHSTQVVLTNCSFLTLADLYRRHRDTLEKLFSEMHSAYHEQPSTTDLTAEDFKNISELMNHHEEGWKRINHFLGEKPDD